MKKVLKRLTAISVAVTAFFIAFTGRNITPPGPWYVGLLIAVIAGLIGWALTLWGLS